MSEVPVSLAGRRVLVVEDDYLVASQAARWLRAAGIDVLGPVPSVAQALHLIEDRQPDGAMLDVDLGYGETTEKLADRLDQLGVPFLFATAAGAAPGAGRHGDRPLLGKPYSEAGLLRTLSGLIASRAVFPASSDEAWASRARPGRTGRPRRSGAGGSDPGSDRTPPR